jgi:hypothetical protein
MYKDNLDFPNFSFRTLIDTKNPLSLGRSRHKNSVGNTKKEAKKAEGQRGREAEKQTSTSSNI